MQIRDNLLCLITVIINGKLGNFGPYNNYKLPISKSRNYKRVRFIQFPHLLHNSHIKQLIYNNNFIIRIYQIKKALKQIICVSRPFNILFEITLRVPNIEFFQAMKTRHNLGLLTCLCSPGRRYIYKLFQNLGPKLCHLPSSNLFSSSLQELPFL